MGNLTIWILIGLIIVAVIAVFVLNRTLTSRR